MRILAISFVIAVAFLLVFFLGKNVSSPPPSIPTQSLPEEPEFAIVKIDAGTFIPSIEHTTTPRFVSEWASSGQEVIVNGSYFQEDYNPSGLLIINGTTIGTRHFDYDKSAMLAIKNNAVFILKGMPADLKSYEYVMQSYPLLIDQGKINISNRSTQRARRSAIGLDASGNVYVIVSDTPDLTLYGFAEKILASGIAFREVLNLDGGPSTGLYRNWGDERLLVDSIVGVPSVLKFRKK